MHRRMEIALGSSSSAVWIEELMVVFRDCVDHVDMSQVDKGATSRFAQMPAHLPPFVQESATEGLAGPPCQLRGMTWPSCMPRAYCQAFPGQACLLLCVEFLSPSLLFLPTCSHTPHALQELPWQIDLQRLCHTLWDLSGPVEPEGLPSHFPPQGPGARVLRDKLI